jgi:hypothetical protein
VVHHHYHHDDRRFKKSILRGIGGFVETTTSDYASYSSQVGASAASNTISGAMSGSELAAERDNSFLDDSGRGVAMASPGGAAAASVSDTIAYAGVELQSSFQKPRSLQNESGITAAGSVSSQQFQMAEAFPLETETHTMILQMLGDIGQRPVVKPVTVKTKVKCESCGTLHEFGAKFCSECSTSLVLV